MFEQEANFTVSVRRETARKVATEPSLKQRKIRRIGKEYEGPKSTRLEVVELDRETLATWRVPKFQRPLTINAKVRGLAQKIAVDGVLPGVLTIGECQGALWRVDCQHRLKGFELSGRAQALADVRFAVFENMADMAEEFDRLNSSLAKMRPDDHMRALEENYPNLLEACQKVTFLGYDKTRHESTSAPLLGMSSTLRCWFTAAVEVPSKQCGSPRELAEMLTNVEADYLIEFLSLAFEAWGREPDFAHLWKKLNLTLCMWVFRHAVVGLVLKPSEHRIDKRTFVGCLKALRTTPSYLDWLRGRTLSERDRGPTYQRLKKIMLAACRAHGARAAMPSPAWAG